MNSFAHVSAATDISRFSALRADARQDAEGAFSKVAQEFEALFIQMMLKAARDASIDGGLFDSKELKLYQEMMDSQVALEMAEQGGLGFAPLLRSQLRLEAPAEAETELGLPERRQITPQPMPAYTPANLTNPVATARVSPAEPVTDQTRAGFIDTVRPLAATAARRLGLEPDVLVAQAALETGWGRHTIAKPDGSSSHNFFGIKTGSGWSGDAVTVQTHEFVNGRPIKVNAAFRAYKDPASAFNDYVDFLHAHPRYSEALQHGGDSRQFVGRLADAGYATDPRYAEKILAIRDQIIARSTLATR